MLRPLDRHDECNGGSSQRSTAADGLGSLSDDILLRIFNHVAHNSKRDLCSISRLNKRYHKLSDGILYRSILFQTPQLHLTFSESLQRRPRRGSAINEIKLVYPSSELSQLALNAPVHNSHYDPTRFDTLSQTLSIMSNLEKLDVAVPDTLLHGIGTIFNGPFDLACLKECSLFYQCADDAYWDLRENIHVFAHPDLQKLVIKRARLDDQGLNLLERPHETGLKTLHLLDCDINDDGLCDLLELAEGLEEFVMTQPAEPEPELQETSDNFADYVLALESQAHSLKRFTIDSPTLSCRKPLRMRHFESLAVMRMNWDYQLFGKSSKKARMHMAALPPQLESLEFLNELGTDAEVDDLLLYMIGTRKNIAPTWQTLIVPNSEPKITAAVKAACKEQELQLHVIGESDDESERLSDDEIGEAEVFQHERSDQL